jgi:hypothetical protein
VIVYAWLERLKSWIRILGAIIILSRNMGDGDERSQNV